MAFSEQVRGERHGSAKLTEAKVLAIRAEARAAERELLAIRGRSKVRPFRNSLVFVRLARKHRVTVATVCNVVYGDTWRHVPGALTKRWLA